jgi:hypothetical protein
VSCNVTLDNSVPTPCGYDNLATLSTLADEIDSMAPDVNPSIDTDRPARVGDLGAEGK